MADRALPDLVSRLRVDTTQLTKATDQVKAHGVATKAAMTESAAATGKFEAAMANASGALGGVARAGEETHGRLGKLQSLFSGGLGMAVGAVALTAGVGIAITAGEDMLRISEHMESAQKSLAQAFKGSSGQLATFRDTIDTWIRSNSHFVKSQSEAVEGFATFTRAGLDQAKAMRDMNIALDLAAIKHISLNDAVQVVTKAEGGRFRGLIDLGITTKSINADMANQQVGADKVAVAMSELEKKTENGRQTTTKMDQAQTNLNNKWQDLAQRIGPPLVELVTHLIEGFSDVFDKLDRFGRNDSWWRGLNDGLINVVRAAQQVIDKIRQVTDVLNEVSYYGSGHALTDAVGLTHFGGRQHGGPVVAGGVYEVGETAPETLFMGRSGGYVVPHAGGGGGRSGASDMTVVVNVAGSVQTERSLALAIREGIRRLDREQR